MSQPGRGHRPDRRSPLSVGLQWASAVTSIGLEMALPALLGAWLDSRYGTGPLWTVLFSTLGFFAAMLHLWNMAKKLGDRRRPRGRTSSNGQGKSL